MTDKEDDKKSSLKACLEESDNPRMQNYVKILDTPNISAFEWIHRTQEEMMDGIVYLEKLKETLSANMRELDAARDFPPEKDESESANIEISVNTTDPPTPVPTPKKRKPKAKPKLKLEDPEKIATVEPVQAVNPEPVAPKRKPRTKKTTETSSA
jgi:outer membrane biosynthesis protein TonB